MNKQHVLALLAVIAVLTACGCNASKGKLAKFDRHYQAGQYLECSEFLEKQMRDRKKPTGEDLLWTLQAGSVKRLQSNYPASTKYFDKAEEAMKYFDLNQSKFVSTIGATAVNDNVVPYLGKEYDGVMLNTYKGLNFIAEKKMDLARVEFNRALDRQRRAKEKFNEEIAELRKEVDKKNAGKNGATVKQSVDNPAVEKIIDERYPDLSAFEVYPDFVNPFTTYMSGLFFNLDGDYSKGADLLKEAYGMVPDNKFIAEDLAETELALSGNSEIEGVCWVIFENGLGPVKDIWRIDLPVFIVTNKVKYVGLALPKLVYRDKAYSRLIIEADDKEYHTDVVADMERVVQTEFQQEYPAIVTRAVMSATIKAAAQYALQEQNSSGSSWAAVAMAAYSLATTTADVRMWTALPKEFQIARFDIPESGKIVIRPPTNEFIAPEIQTQIAENEAISVFNEQVAEENVVEHLPLEIEFGDCKNAVVYVKVIRAGVAAVYNVTEF